MNYQSSNMRSNYIDPVQEDAVVQVIKELESLKSVRPVPVKRLKIRVPTPEQAVIIDQDKPNLLQDTDDYRVSLADQEASQIRLQRRLAKMGRFAQQKRERLVATVVMVTCATGILLGTAIAIISS